jgi:hypothetical protein
MASCIQHAKLDGIGRTDTRTLVQHTELSIAHLQAWLTGLVSASVGFRGHGCRHRRCIPVRRDARGRKADLQLLAAAIRNRDACSARQCKNTSVEASA